MVIKRCKFLSGEGVKMLCKSLNVEFNKADIKIGRDILFTILEKT